jgi:HTH-type transcriptional regulator/antitoxin HipB
MLVAINVPVREHIVDFHILEAKIFPYGKYLWMKMKAMKYTPQDIGKLVRETRKGLGVTQKALALTSGTGLRFIIDLERGKETAEIGKVLTILQTLGIQLTLSPPPATKRG